MNISPSVQIIENNFSTTIPGIPGEIAMFCGHFEKGPVNTPVFISTTHELKTIFGEGIGEHQNDWYQVYNFLRYAKGLWVIRSVGTRVNATNNTTLTTFQNTIIDNQDSWDTQYNAGTLQRFTAEPGVRFIAQTPGTHGNKITVCTISINEFNNNVLLYNNIHAQDVFTLFELDYYGIVVFYDGQVVETFYMLPNQVEIAINNGLTIAGQVTGGNSSKSNYIYCLGDIAINNSTTGFNLTPYLYYNSTAATLTNGINTVPTELDLQDSYLMFDNPDDYQIDIVIGNELNNAAAINLASTRQDCIAFIGIPTRIVIMLKLLITGLPPTVLATSAGTIALTSLVIPPKMTQTIKLEIDKYINTLPRSIFANFILDLRRVHDLYTNKASLVNIAGDAAGLKAIASTHTKWSTGVGLTRGIIKKDGNLSSTYIDFSKAQRDYYYSLGLNYVENDVIMSNKTFMNTPSSYADVTTRSTVNHIIRELRRMLNYVVFNSDPRSLDRLQMNVNRYLNTVKNTRGIQDAYAKVLLSNPNLPNSMIIEVAIKPLYVTKYININVTAQ